MHIKYLLIILQVLLSTILFSQSKYAISGQVLDDEGAALTGATVTVLSQTDSVLLAFAISNQNGRFEINRLKSGNYILQATFLGFSPYSELISIDNVSIEVGEITLLNEAAVIDGVTINAAHIPVIINGDTIQYNAAAFKTKPNASVEDLLKKLPGVEVRADGSIRAQGEAVQNVLVNGKEFFGQDTRIATQNLPADIVDKVEVYDKQSEMAEFSGIDDGLEEKTINLKLKDDKNSGSFGKLTEGYGTDERYQGRGNYNRFSPKAQFSTIGMINNVNEQGFSLNDYLNFMGGIGNMMSGGGGSMRLSFNSDEMGLPINFGNANSGIATTAAIGTNLNYEFNKKTELNGSYFYSKIKNVNDRNLNRQNFKSEGVYNYTELGQNLTKTNSHRLNLKLKHDLTKFSDFIWRANIGISETSRSNHKLSKTFNFSDVLENTSDQNYLTDMERLRINSKLVYRKKFEKKGRIFVARASLSNNQDETTAFVDAQNTFLNSETIPSLTDTLNQEQFRSNEEFSYRGKISYTEPLGKRKYLEVNYSHQNYSNNLLKDFYDRKQGERLFNQDLSSFYEQEYLYDQAGITFKRNKKKTKFSAGFSVQNAKLKGDIEGVSSSINNNFQHMLPFMRWNYDFTTSRNLSFSYSSSVQQPTLRQLQPIIDNSDPLNIYVGNPDLSPEYQHNLNLRYMSFDQFSFVNYYGSLRLRYEQDKITHNRSIDDQFKQTLTPINVKDGFSLSGSFHFGMPIRAIKSEFNIDWQPYYNRSLVFVNNEQNTNQFFENEIEFSIGNRKKEVVDIVIGGRFTFSKSKYIDNPAFDQSYLTQKYYSDLSIEAGKNWSLNTSIDIDIYSAEAFGEALNLPIWTASISKLIMKEKLELKFSVYDILDKNQGIDRRTEANYTQEVSTRTLRQYMMLSATYSLAGFGNHGGMDIQFSGR